MQSLIVAHAHEVTRIGLQHVAKDEFEVVASVGTVKEAKQAIHLHLDAMLVTDVLLDREAIDLMVTASILPMKVAVLTWRENETFIARSLVAGASDYIDLRCTREHVLERLRRVAEGVEFPESPIGKMRDYLDRREEVQFGSMTLTKREGQTLRHLGLGLSNAEIATLMGISVETVKEHVQHLLRKMGMKDRTQAAVWYVRKQMEQEAA